jgi:hypothetical protein
MNDFEDVQRLIRLKRHETPGEEYFERFAENFKDRQRSELLQGSSRRILAERVSLWFDEMGSAKWLIPAGAAAAAVGAGFFLTQEMGENKLSGIAEVEEPASASLPEFPESVDEVIELKLPTTPAPSGESGSSLGSPGLLPASVRGSIREL